MSRLARSVVGAGLTALAAVGAFWLMTMPPGYAPWGAVVVPATAIVGIVGVRMVRSAA